MIGIVVLAGSGCGATPHGAHAPTTVMAPKTHVETTGTGGRRATRTPPLAPPVAPPPPPFAPPPRGGDNDCVPIEDANRYADRLAAHGADSLEQALRAAGATAVERRGFFVDPAGAPPIGQEYSVDGKRLAVVAMMDDRAPPAIMLAQGSTGSLHLIDQPGDSHHVRIRTCGPRPCVYGSPLRVVVRPLVIELQAGERLGDTLHLKYPRWWVLRSHAMDRDCPPPPP